MLGVRRWDCVGVQEGKENPLIVYCWMRVSDGKAEIGVEMHLPMRARDPPIVVVSQL